MGSSKSWTGLTSRQAAELATETVDLVESGDPLGDAAEAGNVELVEKLLKGRGIIFKLDATLLGKILKQLGESEAKKRSTTNGKPGFEHAHLGHSIATTLVGFLRVFGAVSSLFSCWILGYKLKRFTSFSLLQNGEIFGCSITGSGIERLNCLGTTMAKPPWFVRPETTTSKSSSRCSGLELTPTKLEAPGKSSMFFYVFPNLWEPPHSISGCWSFHLLSHAIPRWSSESFNGGGLPWLRGADEEAAWRFIDQGGPAGFTPERDSFVHGVEASGGCEGGEADPVEGWDCWGWVRTQKSLGENWMKLEHQELPRPSRPEGGSGTGPAVHFGCSSGAIGCQGGCERRGRVRWQDAATPSSSTRVCWDGDADQAQRPRLFDHGKLKR